MFASKDPYAAKTNRASAEVPMVFFRFFDLFEQ
jgi:hypothetical protein